MIQNKIKTIIIDCSAEEFNKIGMGIVDLFNQAFPELSKSQIRRNITQGAMKVCDYKIPSDKLRLIMIPQNKECFLII